MGSGSRSLKMLRLIARKKKIARLKRVITAARSAKPRARTTTR